MRAHYSERGIKVCSEWINNFDQFYADMGKKPTPNHQLDRINNDGDYEPGNCRWVTHSQNQRNKHNRRAVTINGEEKELMELSQEYGIYYSTLRHRYMLGIRDENILLSQTKGPKKRSKY